MNKLVSSPTFYTILEYATYAVFLAGWLGAILVQL